MYTQYTIQSLLFDVVVPIATILQFKVNSQMLKTFYVNEMFFFYINTIRINILILLLFSF